MPLGSLVYFIIKKNKNFVVFKPTYRSFIDAQRVLSHPSKELPVVAPSENNYVQLNFSLNNAEVAEYEILTRIETNVVF